MNTRPFLLVLIFVFSISTTPAQVVRERLNATLATGQPIVFNGPKYSADGTRIYFGAGAYGEHLLGYATASNGIRGVYQASSTGGTPTLLRSDAYFLEGEETADASRFVFRGSLARERVGGSKSPLFSWPLSGGSSTMLAGDCDEFALSADSSYAVYLIDDQLFSVSVSGGSSATLLSAAGDEVTQFSITDDSAQVVYSTLSGGTGELSVAAIDGSSTTLLDSLVVRHFKISPSGNYVVYSDPDEVLYSIPISGTGSVLELNRSGTSFLGLGLSDPEDAFVLVADVLVAGDEYVFFARDRRTNSDPNNFYRTPIAGGSAGSALVIHGFDGSAEIFAVDASWAYFRGTYNTSNPHLFRVEADRTVTVPQAVSPGEVPDFSEMLVNDAHTHFVYTKDADGDGSDDLVALDISSATETTLSQTSLSGFGLRSLSPGSNVQITPDGLAVVYLNDEDTANTTELYYVLLNGSGRRKLNSAVADSTDISSFSLNPDSLSANYTETHASGSGVKELHRSDISTGTVSTVGFSGGVDTFDVFDFLFTSDRSKVVYTAYQDSATLRDLYVATPGSGGAALKISPSLTAGGGIYDVRIPDGSEWVFCRANLLAGSHEPTGTDVVACRLDGSASVSLSSVVTGQTALIETISDDGEHLFFYQYDSATVTASIWHVDLTVLPTVVATEVSTGLVDSEFAGEVVISGDGDLAVYEVRNSDTGEFRLYSVELATPGTSLLLWDGDSLGDATLSADGETVWFVGDDELIEAESDGGGGTVLRSGPVTFSTLELMPDGASLFYAVNTGSTYGVCVHPIGGTSYTTVFLTSTIPGKMEASPDGSRILCLTYGSSGQATELYSCKTTSSFPTKLNDTLVADGNVQDFQIDPGSQFAVYRADRDADGKFELFRVDIAGGTPVRLNDAITSTRRVDDDWMLSPDGNYVVYRADQDSANKVELYAAATDGSGSSKLNLPLGSNEDVMSFTRSEDGAVSLYLADDRTADSYELHSVYGLPGSGSIADQATTIDVPVGPVGFTVFDLETPDGALAVSAASSHQSLVRDSQITIAGSGTTRSISLMPEPGVWGGAVTITVTISDGVFEAVETFDVRITPDPNDPPSDITWPTAQLPENAPFNTPVTQFQTIDPDVWDSHEYSLVAGTGDADNLDFRIDGDRLVSDKVFDFEARSNYTVRVRSTDFVGAWSEKVVTVNVLDERGCPTSFSVAGEVDTPIPMTTAIFESNFLLKDGGALEKIRATSLPASGQLKLRFRESVIDNAALGASGVAVGDLNGDLWLDAVAVSAGDNSLRWYRQSGTTFVSTLISSGVIGAADVAVGDLNNDGALDLVTAAAGSGKIDAWISSGGATPTFAVVPVFTGAVGVVAVECFDYDADGDLDIVSASPGDNRVILHRNLNPGWVASVLGGAEPLVGALAIGDMDGDGDPDIACANSASDEVIWFENVGIPTFPRHVVGTVLKPSGLIAADLDSDGDLDLATCSGITGQVAGLFSDGAATPSFVSHHLGAGLGAAVNLSTGDLDSDGKPDLLCAAGDRFVALFNRGGSPSLLAEYDVKLGALGAAEAVMGDFDSDGRMDILAASSNDDTIAWFEDEVLVATGDEIPVDALGRLSYQPAPGFVSTETFGWEGHDGTSWSFAAATVELNVYGTQYWDWLIINFGYVVVADGSQKADVWGANADADGDGEANIYEYASGTDPNDSSDAGAHFTMVMADDGSGDDHLFVSHYFRKAEPDLTYTLELSEDLQTWLSGPTIFSPDSQSTVDAEFEEVTEKVIDAASGTARQFIRLKVEWALD